MSDDIRAEQKGSPWSKTIGAEFLAELGRRWDCFEPLLAALTQVENCAANYPGSVCDEALAIVRAAIARAESRQ